MEQEIPVTKVEVEGEQITALHLRDQESLTARYYIDASGHIGVLRRALGISTEIPTKLQNIAIWDYWTNAEWADEIGVGGTRVQVMSLKHGWIWFIPLSPTRTSIGFICPAEHYKTLKKSPQEIYQEALNQEHRIRKLIANATSRGKIETTKDWSFLAEKVVGENWFLAGESAGFADPILAAGMTLTHVSAREAAYSILELDRGNHDPAWLKTHYQENQRRRIRQHIRFADYWYAANGQFTDLKKHCRNIAKDAGLRLNPEEAFRWLAQGGFANDFLGKISIGGFDLNSMKHVMQWFAKEKATWQIDGYNIFELDLKDARVDTVPLYRQGRIDRLNCYFKQGHQLPLIGTYDVLVRILRQTSEIDQIVKLFKQKLNQRPDLQNQYRRLIQEAFQCLELMACEGWVKTKVNKKKAKLNIHVPEENNFIHSTPNIK